jgi:aspartate/methionine/tyrosine aminotransferase
MKYVRMPIEIESPEEQGYDTIRYNLSESSMRDRRLSELGLGFEDVVLAYGVHRGAPGLRALIAERCGAGVGEADVLTTAGAAGALFIIATTLLEKGDHLVVVRPNYATNIETPRAIGCAIDYLDLTFEEGFRVDVDRIERLVRPETKLISVTTPHNPTGVSLGDAALRRLIALAEARGVRLLVDETYREMSFVPKLPVAATLSDKAISVASMSKSYGIPGIRVGWIVSRDDRLMERFLAAKEQIGICGSIIDERVAEAALAQSAQWLATVERELKEAIGTVEQWLAHEKRMEWVRPEGGCVCFPRIRKEAAIDVEKFYRMLAVEHAACVGPGHWFEQDRRFMRIGFGWPQPAELKGGLAAISASFDAAAR